MALEQRAPFAAAVQELRREITAISRRASRRRNFTAHLLSHARILSAGMGAVLSPSGFSSRNCIETVSSVIAFGEGWSDIGLTHTKPF
eukprot:6175867-Pleurochrysis_carterae.AAC.3